EIEKICAVGIQAYSDRNCDGAGTPIESRWGRGVGCKVYSAYRNSGRGDAEGERERDACRFAVLDLELGVHSVRKAGADIAAGISSDHCVIYDQTARLIRTMRGI